MSDLNMTVDVENIKKMDTFPNREGMMSAEEVKAQFDKAPADIKKHINEVLVPEIEAAKDKAYSSVQFTEQTLKKEQQEQARANIGAAKNTAVLYEGQMLSDEQKEQARSNIGASPNTAVLYTAQGLTNIQKEQARKNIGAAPSGYGWGETAAASIPDGDANNARVTGLYYTSRYTKNVPTLCNFVFVQAVSSAVTYQTAYCTDGNIYMRSDDHDFWSEWKQINGSGQGECVLYTQQELTEDQKASARRNIGAVGSATDVFVRTDKKQVLSQYEMDVARYNIDAVGTADLKAVSALIPKAKQYEHIATITVTPDTDGNLPQHVIFSADSNGNAFELSDFIVKTNAGFVDGAQSSLYMNVNKAAIIANGKVDNISTTCRGFNIFFRKEPDGCWRVEHTASMANANFYNPQSMATQSRLIPSVAGHDFSKITSIDIFTSTGTNKQWVEGSTFELWGVRV